MVDGRDAPVVESVEEMAGRFTSELITLTPGWSRKLRDDPDSLQDLERDVHAAFDRGADLLVAGLLAVVMKQPEFLDDCEQTRKQFAQPLRRGRQRTIRMRLLGGLTIWVASLYCTPRKQAGDQEEHSGLYVELAQFGCGKGVTPGLESRVARQAALCPSLEFACRELAREGARLDVKTVRRITYQCGDWLLRLRKHQLQSWRAGTLPAGSELHGKRVSVQLDGGRTRMRSELRAVAGQAATTDADGLVVEDAPGRSKKRAKKTFDASWREPKLITIFVHDEQGRMAKHSQVTLEGTFLGPDAAAELVAMHLHRLGAAGASSITFAADGAPWIWDRIGQIVAQAKLTQVPIHEVLDCCHATHHVSLALKSLGLNEQERLPLYRQHRSLLRNGQWRRVVSELRDLSADRELPELETEIGYLVRHGEAGRMSYRHFRQLGIPLGSGAIESGIRQVINRRLKSNSLFWRESNAESMLQVRCQLISDRWDERLCEMREFRRQHGVQDWAWTPEPMNVKSEAETSNAD